MANKTFVVAYLIRARDQYSKIAAKVAQSTDRMKKKIKEAGKAFAEFSGKMRKAGKMLSIGATLPIAFLANSLKNAARDAGETESKFGTVFSSISEKANKVAANLAKNYGLASDKSKQLLSDTGDLLSGFGFTQEEALNVSERVNKLAVDLASFTNFSGGAEGASAALTKALLGERESLKSLGIAISEENVKKKIAQLLSEGQRFSSLRQAKAQATLALAVEQSKNAIGDFARTSEDLANQERITNARTRELKIAFGKLLLPISLKITKAIQKMAIWLAALSPGMKKAILIVGGLIAVLGPLLLALGSLVLIWPAIITGVSAFAAIIGVAMSPVMLLAGAALLIVTNWEKVKAVIEKVGSVITDIVDSMKKFGLEGLGKKIFELTHSEDINKVVMPAASRVDVGVKVGLDKGLKRTSPFSVAINNTRRADVGMATGE
ncbi:MAG: hypothetical protein KAT69_00770 [Candidatus Aminicenantes bacterium]|nr:hypothetical protein [Candidatus Aminicenantes bacterium]